MKPKAICILGMHRSGTSAITRGVNLLGAYLGEESDLMGAAPDNPEGYWERNDIYELHERMLATLKRTWDTTAPLPEHWPESREINSFKVELTALIKKNFSGHQLWAWKDPRTMILLPLWKEVLDQLGIELSVIFVLRNPLDIARSLHKRDGFSYDKGFGIWLNYTLLALMAIQDLPTAFISYDAFLSNWELESGRCATVLGISWPEDHATLIRQTMQSFLRPDLRHSASGTDDLRMAAPPGPVLELYDLLLDLLHGRALSDPAIVNTLARTAKEFAAYAQFFQHDMIELWQHEHQLVETNEQLAGLNAQLAERDSQLAVRDAQLVQREVQTNEQLAGLNAQLAERDSQLAARDAQLAEREVEKTEQLAGLNAQLAERDSQLAARDAQLAEREVEIAELHKHIHSLVNSYSWRITEFSRSAYDMIRTVTHRDRK